MRAAHPEEKMEMAMDIKRMASWLGAAVFATAGASASAAEIEAGQWAWGPYAGYYMPDSDVIDAGPTGGLRLGYMMSDHWAVTSSFGYVALEGEEGSGEDEIEADLDVGVVDLNLMYVFRPEAKWSFTAGAGVGWAFVDGEIEDFEGNKITDSLSDDSFTYNVALGPIVKLGERANLRLLTRLRWFDEREDDEMDREITLGLMFPIGGKKAEPVVAAAPPPAPAPKPAPPPPPAKCPDGDKDGVCDASDQCPNTPTGRRVDSAGCDCDFTLNLRFAFDSAELSAEDKAQLDQLAEVLKNPKLGFVAGEIEGHADSMGDETYNQGLSERRAQAVADYLTAAGAALGGKFTAVGYGESRPEADNGTEEGRAQNRRVVVKRNDCTR
jgi:OOP family OmpA-OmpF porin